MKIIPTQDYLVVEPIKEVTKTKHGLELENNQDLLQSTGFIRAVGRGLEDKLLVSGLKVFYRHFPINEIGDMVMVKEEDILAVIKEE